MNFQLTTVIGLAVFLTLVERSAQQSVNMSLYADMSSITLHSESTELGLVSKDLENNYIYNIEYAEKADGSDSWQRGAQSPAFTPTGFTATITGLKSKTSYSIRIVPCTSAGEQCLDPTFVGEISTGYSDYDQSQSQSQPQSPFKSQPQSQSPDLMTYNFSLPVNLVDGFVPVGAEGTYTYNILYQMKTTDLNPQWTLAATLSYPSVDDLFNVTSVNLKPNTTYIFVVQPCRGDQQSPNCIDPQKLIQMQITTMETDLQESFDIKASSDATSITLVVNVTSTNQDSAPQYSFYIEYQEKIPTSSNPQLPWLRADRLPNNVVGFVSKITGLKARTVYSFRIISCTEDGDNCKTPLAVGDFSTDSTDVFTEDIILVTAYATSIVFQWPRDLVNLFSSQDHVYRLVYYQISTPDVSKSVDLTPSSLIRAPTQNDTGYFTKISDLSPSTTYTIQVLYCSVGPQNSCDQPLFTTNVLTGNKATFINKGTNIVESIKATANSKAVNLQWSLQGLIQPGNEKEYVYIVEYRQKTSDLNEPWQRSPQLKYPTTGSSLTVPITNLSPGVVYQFRLVACKGALASQTCGEPSLVIEIRIPSVGVGNMNQVPVNTASPVYQTTISQDSGVANIDTGSDVTRFPVRRTEVNELPSVTGDVATSVIPDADVNQVLTVTTADIESVATTFPTGQYVVSHDEGVNTMASALPTGSKLGRQYRPIDVPVSRTLSSTTTAVDSQKVSRSIASEQLTHDSKSSVISHSTEHLLTTLASDTPTKSGTPATTSASVIDSVRTTKRTSQGAITSTSLHHTNDAMKNYVSKSFLNSTTIVLDFHLTDEEQNAVPIKSTSTYLYKIIYTIIYDQKRNVGITTPASAQPSSQLAILTPLQPVSKIGGKQTVTLSGLIPAMHYTIEIYVCYTKKNEPLCSTTPKVVNITTLADIKSDVPVSLTTVTTVADISSRSQSIHNGVSKGIAGSNSAKHSRASTNSDATIKSHTTILKGSSGIEAISATTAGAITNNLIASTTPHSEDDVVETKNVTKSFLNSTTVVLKFRLTDEEQQTVPTSTYMYKITYDVNVPSSAPGSPTPQSSTLTPSQPISIIRGKQTVTLSGLNPATRYTIKIYLCYMNENEPVCGTSPKVIYITTRADKDVPKPSTSVVDSPLTSRSFDSAEMTRSSRSSARSRAIEHSPRTRTSDTHTKSRAPIITDSSDSDKTLPTVSPVARDIVTTTNPRDTYGVLVNNEVTKDFLNSTTVVLNFHLTEDEQHTIPATLTNTYLYKVIYKVVYDQQKRNAKVTTPMPDTPVAQTSTLTPLQPISKMGNKQAVILTALTPATHYTISIYVCYMNQNEPVCGSNPKVLDLTTYADIDTVPEISVITSISTSFEVQFAQNVITNTHQFLNFCYRLMSPSDRPDPWIPQSVLRINAFPSPVYSVLVTDLKPSTIYEIQVLYCTGAKEAIKCHEWIPIFGIKTAPNDLLIDGARFVTPSVQFTASSSLQVEWPSLTFMKPIQGQRIVNVLEYQSKGSRPEQPWVETWEYPLKYITSMLIPNFQPNSTFVFRILVCYLNYKTLTCGEPFARFEITTPFSETVVNVSSLKIMPQTAPDLNIDQPTDVYSANYGSVAVTDIHASMVASSQITISWISTRPTLPTDTDDTFFFDVWYREKQLCSESSPHQWKTFPIDHPQPDNSSVFTANLYGLKPQTNYEIQVRPCFLLNRVLHCGSSSTSYEVITAICKLGKTHKLTVMCDDELQVYVNGVNIGDHHWKNVEYYRISSCEDNYLVAVKCVNYEKHGALALSIDDNSVLDQSWSCTYGKNVTKWQFPGTTFNDSAWGPPKMIHKRGAANSPYKKLEKSLPYKADWWWTYHEQDSSIVCRKFIANV